MFALGAVLPYAAMCLWMWRTGMFDRFWFWTVVYSRNRAGEVSVQDGLKLFWENMILVVGPNWPLWIAALLGAVVVGWAKDARKARWFVFAYFAFSFLCVCPGFYFRQHYFIVLLPAVAVLGGMGCAWLLRFAAHWHLGRQTVKGSRKRPSREPRRNRRDARAAAASPAGGPGILLWPAIGLLLAAGIFIVWQQREFFFVWTPTQACRAMNGRNPFPEALVIADYLNRHSTPDQQVAVFGSEPELFFYAKRRSATRHIYVYPLVERQPSALQMQQEMCQEVEAAKPEFVVVVQTPLSWLPAPDCSRLIYKWSENYIRQFYRPVGLVESSRRSEPSTDGTTRPQTPNRAPPTTCGFSSARNDEEAALRGVELPELIVPPTICRGN